jgi:hypothetical protein
MGIRANLNPYVLWEPWWCAGCPSVFGGNDDGNSAYETCSREAAEESHGKLDLEGAHFAPLGTYEMDRERSAYFYIATGFDYQENYLLSPALANQAKYRETTGEILLLDLDSAPRRGNMKTALWMLQQLREQFGASRSPVRGEFVRSAMVQAFEDLVMFHRAGGIPE